MKNQLINNLKNDIYTVEIENKQFGENFPFLLPPDVYSSISILWNSDEFYNQLNEYLNLNDIQQDLFNFNRNMMITPDYNPSIGRSWSNHYDWLSWFNTHFTGVVTDKISQFPKKINISYMATDTHTTYSVYDPLEILWHKQNNELEHLMDYFYKCCYGSKTDKLFKNITII